MAEITDSVTQAYNDFYNHSDTAWRMLGAKAKAGNIIEVCKAMQPQKVIEVGAGDGSILYYLEEWDFGKELYALEIAESGVQHIRDRKLSRLKDVRTFDGYNIPYPDDNFDLVILAHVLEHVEHERQLLRELKRVSKYIVIEVPLDYRFGVDKRLKHFLDYGHINMYTPTLLRFLLKSEGLEILADKTSLTPPEITMFNEFVNKKVPKAATKVFKIKLEYWVKEQLGNLLGTQKKEQFANAYTVLTKTSDKNLQIF